MNIDIPKNVQFECQRCARCCGDAPHRSRVIYLLEKEVEKISNITNMHPMQFASPISGAGKFKYKMKRRGGACIFLKNGACTIYEHRPLVCRLYPFFVRKTEKGIVFEIYDDCPGIGLGQKLQEVDFKKLIEAAKEILS
ncbi:MAG: YkgJ family cysteine cluster protein [Candidatus Hadarchaeales archaeon]